LKKSWEIIHKYLDGLAFWKLASYTVFLLFIQLRIPATMDPTIKKVAIAYEPVLTAGIVAA
jgi:hypothetical protein